jgi:tRNA A-37 threonylcarbamoyl transferase component Bud32
MNTQEARGIVKCSRSGVLAPALYYVDEAKAHLYLEYIDAPTVRAVLASKPGQGMILAAHASWALLLIGSCLRHRRG